VIEVDAQHGKARCVGAGDVGRALQRVVKAAAVEGAAQGVMFAQVAQVFCAALALGRLSRRVEREGAPEQGQQAGEDQAHLRQRRHHARAPRAVVEVDLDHADHARILQQRDVGLDVDRGLADLTRAALQLDHALGTQGAVRRVVVAAVGRSTGQRRAAGGQGVDLVEMVRHQQQLALAVEELEAEHFAEPAQAQQLFARARCQFAAHQQAIEFGRGLAQELRVAQRDLFGAALQRAFAHAHQQPGRQCYANRDAGAAEHHVAQRAAGGKPAHSENKRWRFWVWSM
jgi:hypothetical protein